MNFHEQKKKKRATRSFPKRYPKSNEEFRTRHFQSCPGRIAFAKAGWCIRLLVEKIEYRNCNIAFTLDSAEECCCKIDQKVALLRQRFITEPLFMLHAFCAWPNPIVLRLSTSFSKSIQSSLYFLSFFYIPFSVIRPTKSVTKVLTYIYILTGTARNVVFTIFLFFPRLYHCNMCCATEKGTLLGFFRVFFFPGNFVELPKKNLDFDMRRMTWRVGIRQLDSPPFFDYSRFVLFFVAHTAFFRFRSWVERFSGDWTHSKKRKKRTSRGHFGHLSDGRASPAKKDTEEQHVYNQQSGGPMESRANTFRFNESFQIGKKNNSTHLLDSLDLWLCTIYIPCIHTHIVCF